MNNPTLNVIIPSRTQHQQVAFLKRAIDSVRANRMFDRYDTGFLVGVDAGNCEHLFDFKAANDIRIVESSGKSQAVALNAAIQHAESDFVAFLEDDDQWHSEYLANVGQAISFGAKFVSSTQLEVNEVGQIQRINDFPTPSGWFMPMSTLRSVGLFNEAYRFHLDNEWLGRLAETDLQRCHLVECTAPAVPNLMAQVRPWLLNVLQYGGRGSAIGRHDLPFPLVSRLVHARSGMAQIANNEDDAKTSTREIALLNERFGRVPW